MLPTVEAWSEGRDLAFGSLVVAVIALSFSAAVLLARRAATQTA
jgi:high-affinity nickel-transport protein